MGALNYCSVVPRVFPCACWACPRPSWLAFPRRPSTLGGMRRSKWVGCPSTWRRVCCGTGSLRGSSLWSVPLAPAFRLAFQSRVREIGMGVPVRWFRGVRCPCFRENCGFYFSERPDSAIRSFFDAPRLSARWDVHVSVPHGVSSSMVFVAVSRPTRDARNA